MQKTSLRLLASSALSLSLVVAGSATALAQQPTPPPVPPVEEAQPAQPATPAVEPAPVAPPPEKKSEASPIEVSYDKGIKFESEDGEFEGKLSLRTQFRFELNKGTQDGAEYKEFFSLPRGRLQLEGHVWGKFTLYKLEFSLADKLGFAFTKDLWLEQQFKDGKLGLRVGQMKGPFNRQELVSDFASEFNERAITSEWVKGGRDLGILFNNGYADKAVEGLEWSFGLFNSFAQGTDKVTVACPADPMTGVTTCDAPTGGVNRAGDWSPAVFARVAFSKGAKFKGYSEADLEGGPLRFGVGLSYKVDLAQLRKGTHTSLVDNMQQGVGLDAALKVEGFDAALGVFLMGFRDKQTGLGAHIQAGYFVMPKKLQVAARYAFVPNDTDPDKQDIEVRGALNYYFHGHQWKWANDFGITKFADGAAPMNKSDKAQISIRSMAQLTF